VEIASDKRSGSAIAWHGIYDSARYLHSERSLVFYHPHPLPQHFAIENITALTIFCIADGLFILTHLSKY
jgi:hypothetical protein